jgi:hypothetical protein
MGDVALGPFLAAAGLLVAAAAPKLVDPASLVRALRSVGLPAGALLVRGVAAAELVVGAAALVRPDRVTGVLVAFSYAAFSGFVALALARGGVLASCGCFGRADTPPTRSHLLVTSVLAASGVVVASSVPPSPWSSLAQQPGVGAALVGFAVLVAGLSYLVMVVLPTVSPVAVRSASAPRRG